jgi:C2 domain of PTEN tumour-suppressor protein
MFDLSQQKMPDCSGDICIMLLDGGSEVGHVWINTNFIENTAVQTFSSEEIDFASSDVKKKLSSGFSIIIEWLESNSDLQECIKEGESLGYEPEFINY